MRVQPVMQSITQQTNFQKANPHFYCSIDSINSMQTLGKIVKILNFPKQVLESLRHVFQNAKTALKKLLSQNQH